MLSHNPDLIVVCFGLNDVNNPLEEYIESMEEIFDKGLKSGAEVIFMTPNMLNTSVAEDTPKKHFEYAIKTSKMQNEGSMDVYIESAVELAKKWVLKFAIVISCGKSSAKLRI